MLKKLIERATRAATETVESKVLRFDTATRSLVVRERAWAAGVRHGLARVERFREVSVTPHPTSVEIEVKVDYGIGGHARLSPRRVVLSRERVRFEVELEEPIALEHEIAAFGFLLRAVDGMFGLADKGLASIDGFETDGTTIQYGRSPDDVPLLGTLAKTLAPNVRVDVPTELVDGDLHIRLAEVWSRTSDAADGLSGVLTAEIGRFIAGYYARTRNPSPDPST